MGCARWSHRRSHDYRTLYEGDHELPKTLHGSELCGECHVVCSSTDLTYPLGSSVPRIAYDIILCLIYVYGKGQVSLIVKYNDAGFWMLCPQRICSTYLLKYRKIKPNLETYWGMAAILSLLIQWILLPLVYCYCTVVIVVILVRNT